MRGVASRFWLKELTHIQLLTFINALSTNPQTA